MKGQRGGVQELLFLERRDFEMAAGACVEKSLAKEFAVSGVDQGVRRQNLRQAGERAPGSEEKAATGQLVALRLQACLKAADRAESEASCLGLRARDDGTGLAGGIFSAVW